MQKLFRGSHGGDGSLSSILRKQTKPLSLLSHLHYHSDVKALVPANHAHRRIPRLVADPVTVRRLKISHPWPEWLDFMELLLRSGYFCKRESMLQGVAHRDLTEIRKEANLTRTACLEFSRDRVHLVSYLSRKDIGVIVSYGCPSLDRKVVNSGKRLREYANISEKDSCGSCNLRPDCTRAFANANGCEGAQTVDVMRVLLTYGLDPVAGMVENRPSWNVVVQKSARILLKEIVECSSKTLKSNLPMLTTLQNHIRARDLSISQEKGVTTTVPMKLCNWRCSICNFQNFEKHLKCKRCEYDSVERLEILKEYHKQHLPLKQGDWKCEICNFMNYAKNLKCMICRENPTNRKLKRGEWECSSCNYVNFRTNMACLRCDHRRPKTANISFDLRLRVEGKRANVSPQIYTWTAIGDESKQQCGYLNSKNKAFYFPLTRGRGNSTRDKEDLSCMLEMLESKDTVIKDVEFQSSYVPKDDAPKSVLAKANEIIVTWPR